MKEIVIIPGFPAAGKSSLCAERFANYNRLNRDTIGGSLADIAGVLDRQISDGIAERFVLDNTYATRVHRKAVIDVGKRHGIPVRCVWLKTSIEDAQVNACQRMIERHGKLLMPEEISTAKDPNIFPTAVLFKFRKEFEPPTTDEGFSTLEEVRFVRKLRIGYTNKAAILDFDGTLRKTKSGAKFPTTIDDVEILPGRTEVLKRCQAEGYKLLGVSNQSGVAKGDLTADMAKAIFIQTNKLLRLDIDFAFCPHTSTPISCYCRKPMPGSGVAFIEKYKLNPDKTIMVGDMTTDKTFAGRCGFKYMDQSEFFK